MAATSRVGMLLVLAACGGGKEAGRSDTTATASVPPAEQPTTGTADTSMAGAGGAASDTSMAPAAPSTAESASTKVQKTDTTKKPKAAAAAKPSAPAAPSASQDTGKKAAAAAAKPAGGGAAGGGAQSPQQIALGDSVFHGQVAGGTCTACHGQDAKGTPVAPDLTDSQWLNGDGSYTFIVNTVTNGVPMPKQHPAPMPPKGGAPLNDDQVKAVAAYVYSLSHKS